MKDLRQEVKQLREEVEKIHKRNKRVEADKAWEISLARKIFIACATYLLVLLFFLLTNQQNPFSNAIIPVAGFLLSNFTYDLLKRWWLKKQ